MTKEHDAILEAKRSLKAHISFLETLVKHLNGPDKVLRSRAAYTAWCIHRYFNDRLMGDLQAVIAQNTPQGSENVQ